MAAPAGSPGSEDHYEFEHEHAEHVLPEGGAHDDEVARAQHILSGGLTVTQKDRMLERHKRAIDKERTNYETERAKVQI